MMMIVPRTRSPPPLYPRSGVPVCVRISASVGLCVDHDLGTGLLGVRAPQFIPSSQSEPGSAEKKIGAWPEQHTAVRFGGGAKSRRALAKSRGARPKWLTAPGSLTTDHRFRRVWWERPRRPGLPDVSPFQAWSEDRPRLDPLNFPMVSRSW
jgi:hypothetical protein